MTDTTTLSRRTLSSHPAIDEALVIERYLCGDLDDEETAAFEAHALDCPRCLDELEADERFRAAFPVEEPAVRLDEDAKGADAAEPPAPRPFAPPARRPRIGRGSTRATSTTSGPAVWALAAALLVSLAALFVVLQQNRELAGLLERGGLETGRFDAPPVLRLSPLRDAGTLDPAAEPAVRLRLDASTPWVVLALDVEPPLAGRYDCTLVAEPTATGDSPTEPLWSGTLRPDPWGSATLLVPSRELSTGRHALRCTPDSDGGSGNGGSAASARFVVDR